MKHALLAAIGAMAVGIGSAGAQEGRTDSDAKVRNRLATMRVSLDFTDARLRDVIAYLQEFSGLNFHVDAEIDAKDDAGRVTIKVKDVTLRSALKLVLNPRNLGCVYRDGVLVVLPKSKIADRTTTRVYDARDLAFGLQDFPGPRMEMSPPGSKIIDNRWYLHEEPVVKLSTEFLAELIKSSVGGDSWVNGSPASIMEANGLLIITQSAAVHDEIARLLNLLRQYK